MGHETVTRGAGGLVCAALVSLALAGCGGGARDAALSESQLQADYRGAPATLAALFAGRNKLLRGGAAAFERELRRLRGRPVVVNTWASWCQNCVTEFSIFQRVAPRYGRTVAFVGDDVEGATAGHGWLARYPLSFPSFSDPSESIDRAIGAATASYAPVTYFYDRHGKEVYFHFGPYLSAASLEHDIRLYLGA